MSIYGHLLTFKEDGMLHSDKANHIEIYIMWCAGYEAVKVHKYDKYIGSIVKVKDYIYSPWSYDTYEGFMSVGLDGKGIYRCKNDNWNYLEPFTEEDVTSIILNKD
jgi:hypothetical protein